VRCVAERRRRSIGAVSRVTSGRAHAAEGMEQAVLGSGHGEISSGAFQDRAKGVGGATQAAGQPVRKIDCHEKNVDLIIWARRTSPAQNRRGRIASRISGAFRWPTLPDIQVGRVIDLQLCRSRMVAPVTRARVIDASAKLSSVLHIAASDTGCCCRSASSEAEQSTGLPQEFGSSLEVMPVRRSNGIGAQADDLPASLSARSRS